MFKRLLLSLYSRFLRQVVQLPSLDSLPGVTVTLADFELHCQEHGWKPIYHVTDHESATSIVSSKVIGGFGGFSAAHFHHSPDLAWGQATNNGIVLGFSWSGEIRRVNLSNPLGTYGDRTPNVLFDAPVAKYLQRTWELRLYPGTNSNLELRYLQIDSRVVILDEPLAITVQEFE